MDPLLSDKEEVFLVDLSQHKLGVLNVKKDIEDEEYRKAVYTS